MAADEDIAAGLVKWINSLKVNDPVSTIDELATGEVLWKLLQLVDHLAFPGSLPEDPSPLSSTSKNSPQSWIPKWTNLKHVYDALSIFLIEECGQQLPLFFSSATGHKANPDLKAIAQHASLPDAIILLKLCVVAATSCEENRRFLEGMQELGEGVQRVLMETIQEAQESTIEYEEDDEEDYNTGDVVERDEADTHYLDTLQSPRLDQPVPTSDLAFEERLATVIAESQRIARDKTELKRELDDQSARYSTLQERFDRAQEELSESNDRLSAVLSGRTIGSQQTSDAQKEAVIAQLEARVAEYETDIEGLRKNNEVLKIKAERTQKLQDDYDELRIDRENLSRKANAAEKYRLKLEQSQDQDKENAALKQKITDLQSQLREGDRRQASGSDLQREIDEYRRLLPAIEQERHEVNEMKKRLEFDYHLLQARYSESEETNRRARQEIEDLQGRLRELDEGYEPSSRRTTTGEQDDALDTPEGKDLETEEADYAAAEARLTEALLRAEAATETGPEETDQIKDKPALQIPDDLSENAVSESELRAIMSAMRAQMLAGTATERETGVKMQKRMVIMLEKLRSRNEKLVEFLHKQAEDIEELEKRPLREKDDQTVEEEDDEKTKQRKEMPENQLIDQLDEQDELISNLKREIRLISSAWYEQNQRLSTLGAGSGGGAVALMRLKGGHGLEEPKSFLGRQRRMLDRVVTGGAVGRGGRG